MDTVLFLASWLLLLGGSAFLLISGFGLLRFPDLFTRMHAASLSDTLGAALIVGGLALQTGDVLVIVKLVFILVFLFFTTPTSTHALAKAAISDGVKPATVP